MNDFPFGFRTLEDRQDRARELARMVDAGLTQKGTLPLRWERAEQFYRNDPPKRAMEPFPGASDEHDPLIQPKVDALTANVVGTITASEPYVVIRLRGSLDRADAVERDLQFAFEDARLDEHLRVLGPIVGNCAKGILRAYFEANEERVGLKFDVVHPQDFVAYPAAISELRNMRLVGHRLAPMRVAEIRSRQRKGEYIDDEHPIAGGYDPELANDRSLTEGASNIEQSDDQLVECFELIFRQADEKGVEKWLIATLDYTDNVLLRVRPYDLPRPWYFDFAYKREYGGFWFQHSVAQDLQGIQLLLNHVLNMHCDGVTMSSFGVTFEQDYAGTSKVEKYGPGQIIPVDDIEKIQNWAPPYSGAQVPFLLGYLRDRADEVARISAAGSGGEFKSGMTATEATQIQAGQQVGVNEFIANFGLGLIELARFSLVLLKTNFNRWKAEHGDALAAQLPEDYSGSFRFDLNGKTPGNTPLVQFQTAAQLLQMLGSMPAQETGIDPYELVHALVLNSGLPNAEKIQVSKENLIAQERLRQAAMALQALRSGGNAPAMGGVPGGMAVAGIPDLGQQAPA